MSYPDPFHGTEPRGRERPAAPSGMAWPDDGRDARFPALRDGAAAPMTHPRPPGPATDHWPSATAYGPGRGGTANGRPGAHWPDHDVTEQIEPVRPGPGPGPGFGPYVGTGDAVPRVDPARGVDPTAETNPVGWPPITVEPEYETGYDPGPGATDSRPGAGPDPEPPRRLGPGRRRAGRGARPAGTPAGTPAPTGRAGRNLPAAIGVGLGLGAVVVVSLFVYPPAFLLVIAAAAGVGIWEMVRAVGRVDARPPLVPLLVGGLAMVGLAWWAGPDALSLALLVTVLAAMVWRLGDGPRGFQRDLTATALIAVYVPFLGGFAALLAAAPDDGHLRVLVTLIAVVLSDVGGYAAGVSLGRHPLAPSVSPKKSWEGFGGSVLAAAVGSAALLVWLFDVAPWWGATFGVAVAVAAVLGDLGESMIKRDLGVKDMSNLLPGHGGMMDRLDSVLFAVPTAYLLLAIFAPAG